MLHCALGLCDCKARAFFYANVTLASLLREVARDSVTEGLFFQILAFLPLCVILSGAKAESNPNP